MLDRIFDDVKVVINSVMGVSNIMSFHCTEDVCDMPCDDETGTRTRHFHGGVLSLVPLQLHNIERETRKPNLPGLQSEMERDSVSEPFVESFGRTAAAQRSRVATGRPVDDRSAPPSYAPHRVDPASRVALPRLRARNLRRRRATRSAARDERHGVEPGRR